MRRKSGSKPNSIHFLPISRRGLLIMHSVGNNRYSQGIHLWNVNNEPPIGCKRRAKINIQSQSNFKAILWRSLKTMALAFKWESIANGVLNPKAGLKQLRRGNGGLQRCVGRKGWKNNRNPPLTVFNQGVHEPHAEKCGANENSVQSTEVKQHKYTQRRSGIKIFFW